MKVAIAAIGARTAVGYTASQSAAAVRAGLANFNASPFLVDGRGDPMVLAQAPGIAAVPDACEHLTGLALAALEDLAGTLPGNCRRSPVPLLLALPAPRPGLPADYPERVRAALWARAPVFLSLSDIETFDTGHAAGLLAIGRGIELLRQGQPLVLVAAADSWLQVDTLEWLDHHSRLHSPSMAWGFVPGEAGAACLLGTPQTCRRLGQPCLALIESVAGAAEPAALDAAAPCTGAGLTAALQAVLDPLPPGTAAVGAIYCDLNGERHRADEAGFALVRTSEYLRDPGNLVSPADCWGDIGAASGLLLASLPIAAALRGYTSARRALLWCSSDGPERAAALLATGTAMEPTGR